MLAIIGRHADSLLRVAQRHSLCPDDAQDAYQRALEIFLRHAPALDADRAHLWIHTVVKHESMRLRAARSRSVGTEEHDLDAHAAPGAASPHEQVLAFEHLTRSAEALQRLKPQELRALWLKAQGHSYQEIAELCSWTYTKVNRCITEGRRSFLERYAGIESGEECRRWEPLLSAIVDGEAGAAELAKARPHLRNCPACRATIRRLRETKAPLAALLRVPVVAAGVHHEPAGGLLSRIYEALAGPLHERAIASTAKLQATVDAVAGGKMAAVAAGAAALAGGGVAVDRAVQRVSHPAQRPAARSASAPAQPAVRDVRAAGANSRTGGGPPGAAASLRRRDRCGIARGVRLQPPPARARDSRLGGRPRGLRVRLGHRAEREHRRDCSARRAQQQRFGGRGDRRPRVRRLTAAS